ncbi:MULTISPECIES: hypothetical protein [unclassified Rhizobacter]|uniref:hypothetical protein n=1 Tax=unclassified Rhizobacter TaxID=2640088 RepID=UPI000AD9DFA1|nr:MULTISPECIES: hypothetical protein [unclassified Rhizobacter]
MRIWLDKRSLSGLVSGLSLAGAAFAIDDRTVHVPADGQTIVGGIRAKQSVCAMVTTTVMSGVKGSADVSALVERECATQGSSCSLVTSLEIAVNGRPLVVPRSSFRGLGNVRTAKLVPKGNSFHLVLRGGDGADGFVATIVFDRDRVLKRWLASNLAPEGVLEETTYRAQKESFDR